MTGSALGLPLIELRLRIATCKTALVKLRQSQRYRASYIARFFSDLTGHSSSEGMRTCARGQRQGIENTITRHVTRYCASYHAIQQLAPLDASHRHLQPLLAADNTGPVPEVDEVLLERQDKKMKHLFRQLMKNATVNAQLHALAGLLPGQGRRELLWIWFVYRAPPSAISDLATADALVSGAATISRCAFATLLLDAAAASKAAELAVAAFTIPPAPGSSASSPVASSAVSTSSPAGDTSGLAAATSIAQEAQDLEEAEFSDQVRTDWAKCQVRLQFFRAW
jgi:hypothetical protein